MRVVAVPAMRSVNAVCAASGAAGVKTRTVLLLSNVTAPATEAPPLVGATEKAAVVVAASIGRLNVTRTGLVTGNGFAPGAGVDCATVGATVETRAASKNENSVSTTLTVPVNERKPGAVTVTVCAPAPMSSR